MSYERPPVSSHRLRARARRRRGGALALLIVVALVVFGVVSLKPQFDAKLQTLNVNGLWHGQASLTANGVNVEPEMYLNLHQTLIGTITGDGYFCLNPGLNAPLQKTSFQVTGTTDLAEATIKETPQAGDIPAQLTPGLTIKGNVARGQLTLRGGDSDKPFASTLRKGSERDAENECTRHPIIRL